MEIMIDMDQNFQYVDAHSVANTASSPGDTAQHHNHFAPSIYWHILGLLWD
jgi:heme/copper-type cytochrome/quinol oxidase subunit 3